MPDKERENARMIVRVQIVVKSFCHTRCRGRWRTFTYQKPAQDAIELLQQMFDH